MISLYNLAKCYTIYNLLIKINILLLKISIKKHKNISALKAMKNLEQSYFLCSSH